ncbi:MAG: hypothetical protein D6748_13765 [Calditrichaeota bacterium]|nr:MAG: hypothetical protein D6748_13765 [Calditrichota bacterium]
MNVVQFFTLPTSEDMLKKLLAIAIYDCGNAEDLKFDHISLQAIFRDSLKKASQKIIRSEKTFQQLMNSLQDETAREKIERLSNHQDTSFEEHVSEQLSRHISERNAGKIANALGEELLFQIRLYPELLEQIVYHYRHLLEQPQWNFPLEFPSEEAEPHSTTSSLDVERHFIRLFINNPDSGQLPYWDEHFYIWPVRGMRKIEDCLKNSPNLLILGGSGSGKTTLISAYLHIQVAQKQFSAEDVFYYRFVNNISNYTSFLNSLLSFCNLSADEEDAIDILWRHIANRKAIFVLDDVGRADEELVKRLLTPLWETIKKNKVGGKCIFLSREKPEGIDIHANEVYQYPGLSQAEGNALLRDKWALDIPTHSRKILAYKLKGLPPLFIIFRNWWTFETHTDTELERFIEHLPSNEAALYQYSGKHLHTTFERTDPRLNSLLCAASIFRQPETEAFYEKTYQQIGGGEFQQVLELLVEWHRLLSFDDHLNRYDYALPLKDFYYHLICTPQMRRILHSIAGTLYRERAQQTGNIQDALESAYHFYKAEDEREAAMQVQEVLSSGSVNGNFSGQIFELLRNLNLEALDNKQMKIQVLYNRGQLYFQQGELDLAEKDLALCEQLHPPKNLQGSVLLTHGKIAKRRNETELAVRFLQDSMELFEALEDEQNIIQAAGELAEILLEKQEFDQVLKTLRRVEPYCEKVQDDRCKEKIYFHLGQIYAEKLEWDVALNYFQKLLQIYNHRNDTAGIVSVLEQMAQIHEALEEWNQAIENYYESLQLREKLDDWKGLAECYEHLGNLYKRKDELDLAIDFYQEAQELFRQHEYTTGLATIYMELGDVYLQREEWDLALGFYQKSQEIFEKTEDVRGIAKSFEKIAETFRAQKDWERSLDMLEKALEIRERLGESDLTDVYLQIGDTYFEKGELEHALSVYQRCIEMKQTVGDSAGAAGIYYNMGKISQDNGHLEDALNYFKQAKSLYGLTQHARGIARSLHAIGSVHQQMGDWDSALEVYKQALKIYDYIGDSKGVATVCYTLGTVFHDQGDWEQALSYYHQTLPRYEKSGDLLSMAQAIGNISSIEFEQGEHIKAITHQIEVLLYFYDHDHRELVDKVLSNLVACHQELGAEVFQPLLQRCLQRVANNGVTWGKHLVIIPEKAASMIRQLFPDN